MNARAFRGEGEDRQRIRILAADQPAHRPVLTRKCAERVAEAAHVHEALTDRRHDLLMLAYERAVRPDIDLGVEHGADRVRHLLANTDDYICVRIPRGFT